jgi:hypothetical protein
VTHRGNERIKQALDLLNRFAPDEYSAVFRKLRSVEVNPRLCPPGAIACTGKPIGRKAVLVRPPEFRSAIDVAVTLRHEAHHIVLLPGGRWTILSHICGPCDTPELQSIDPIYQRDAQVRAAIVRGLEVEALLALHEERRRQQQRLALGYLY